MMMLGTVYSYSVFRLALENALGIGNAASGLPYLTALAFYSLFVFLSGKFITRYPPSAILIAGGLLLSLGWILASFSSNIIFLSLSYGVIGGAGVGIAYGVIMTVAARWFPEKKGLAVGLVLLGFGMSPLVTAPLAAALVERMGVFSAFRILGIIFAVAIPLLALPFKYPHMHEPMPKASRNAANGLLKLLPEEMVRTRSFKGLYLNLIIGSMIGLMLIGMTTSIGAEYIGLEPQRVTRYMTVFALMNGGGRPFFGWLTDRLSPAKAMLTSYGLMILAALMLIASGPGREVIFVWGMAIFWFNLGGWLAIAPASTLRLYGAEHYSRNYGLVFTAYGIGAILGVLSSGLLLDLFQNYRFVFSYILILCFFGMLITRKWLQSGKSARHS